MINEILFKIIHFQLLIATALVLSQLWARSAQ